ncbi:DUF4260 domain-containing protein [Svornostia abyssi]|uniref:DUF4260 domain-containing protein n=1 Tax=Svornostia abyssi TaxID=2898438 RepID=A0ABY5PHW9_9ACTN|nr:DUF4260 domain-containing protein [Parviterribacteraceae bacterium J379]
MTAATVAPRTVLPRLVHAVVAIAALGGAVVLIGPVALALWIVPDVALLPGLSKEFGDGRLAPRAVPFYNAAHALPGPVVLGVVAAVTVSPLLAGLALVWLSHITGDRALGYGLRTPEGWQRG